MNSAEMKYWELVSTRTCRSERKEFWNGPQAAGAVAFADIYCEIKPQDIEFSMFLCFFLNEILKVGVSIKSRKSIP